MLSVTASRELCAGAALRMHMIQHDACTFIGPLQIILKHRYQPGTCSVQRTPAHVARTLHCGQIMQDVSCAHLLYAALFWRR